MNLLDDITIKHFERIEDNVFLVTYYDEYVTADDTSSSTNQRLIIINSDYEEVGNASVDLSNLDNVIFSELIIYDEYRRQGYGEKLLSTALKYFHIKSIRCYEDNIPAINLYKKLGFVKGHKLGDGLIDMLNKKEMD